MTDLLFIEILEKWKRDEIGIETVLDAADAYSLADNGAKPIVSGSVCTCRNAELEKDSLVPVYCNNCNAYVQTDR